MEETTLRDVIAFIQKATSDDLDRIVTAWKVRSKTVRAEEAALNAATLSKGDQVVTKGLSPKYLNGLVCTVIRIDGSKILVDSGFPQGRYGQELLVPASCLEAV